MRCVGEQSAKQPHVRLAGLTFTFKIRAFDQQEVPVACLFSCGQKCLTCNCCKSVNRVKNRMCYIFAAHNQKMWPPWRHKQLGIRGYAPPTPHPPKKTITLMPFSLQARESEKRNLMRASFFIHHLLEQCWPKTGLSFVRVSRNGGGLQEELELGWLQTSFCQIWPSSYSFEEKKIYIIINCLLINNQLLYIHGLILLLQPSISINHEGPLGTSTATFFLHGSPLWDLRSNSEDARQKKMLCICLRWYQFLTLLDYEIIWTFVLLTVWLVHSKYFPIPFCVHFLQTNDRLVLLILCFTERQDPTGQVNNSVKSTAVQVPFRSPHLHGSEQTEEPVGL